MATVTLEVPTNDLNIFETIVQRMGWIMRREISDKPVFSPSEVIAAKKRGETMRQFIDKFKTDDISEEDILAECDAVRQEMYEERQQGDACYRRDARITWELHV